MSRDSLAAEEVEGEPETPRVERAIVRVFGVVFSGAAVLQLVFLLPIILAEQPALIAPWNAVAGLLVFGPMLAMGIAACFPGYAAIRALLAAAVVLGLVVLFGLPLVRVEGSEPIVAWPTLVSALFPTMAACILNARMVVVVGLVTIAGDVLCRIAFDPVGFRAAWFDIVQVLAIYCLLFSAVALLIRKSAARVDAARATLEREIGENSTRAAVEHEQVRLDGMVHDEVLAVLVSAAKADESDLARPEFRKALEAGARRARSVLHQQRDADPTQAFEDPEFSDGARVTLQALIAQVHANFPPRVSTTLSVSGDPVMELQSAVAGVLQLATAEALLNVERHAHARNCWVSITADEGVEIRVIDNGTGFVPERAGVHDNRMGIRVSIVGRMRSVPGGDAWIESAPMYGTTVVLQWQP